MIQLKNVSKVYKVSKNQVKALDDISLEIKDGEFLAILGPSGSGKSTLMHLLGGLDKPTSGEILVEGQNLAKLSDKKLSKYRNARVGFVFQAYNLHPIFNARENASLPLILSKDSETNIKQKSEEVLKEVDLLDRAEHLPKELSGGEQQRVAIARAIITNPQIILADEPTGNLDTKTGEQVIDLLMRLNKNKQITLIIVTHNEDIAKLASRIIRVRDGRLE